MIDQEYKAWCAYQLHDLGLMVLPVHYPVDGHCSCRRAWTCGSPAKHPACSLKDLAAQSEEDVYRMLREHPPHNLGVSVAGTRLVVLDIDPVRGGDQALAELESRRRESLTPTLTVAIGRGGLHLYYRLPADADLVRDRMWFLHGVDVKAAAGMLVVPLSRSILSGEYVFASPVAAPAELPADVLRRLHRTPRARDRRAHPTLHVPSRAPRAVSA